MMQNDDVLLRPAMLFAFLKALPMILLAIIFLLLAWWLSPYFILFSLAICGAAWYRLLYIRSFQYLITAEYIRITRGIFFKRIDQVEMYRVKDYIITQSFILQLFRLMYLTLKSTDPENPVVLLQGIPESDITDTIRDRVQEARKDNNIYELN
ncbi:PH domain-containing protein [Mucilaginibacter gotjawali]|uniref:Bacterial membrane flanked domain protein n=2 Tax=Mucilaginibacter gotjawali TaxID=1550579 RepID=A0A110B044_9SPHI|nr:PH domain-containing protein [Mucilaginibacter gotjawali]MBB3058003.1 putative membrane protein YdbT with pleckstrin-like domain [Mucilaginibacter gotjawali]BAU51979.1 Bacterial membrane flanked domain protein [Mucilaginibacter gotjawali]